MSFEERWGDKSEEIRNKISETNKRLGIKPPVQHWENGNHPMLGKTHTDEAREKISLARMGKNYEEIYGSEKSIEIKQKLSSAWSGDKNPNYIEDLSIDDEIKLIKLLYKLGIVNMKKTSMDKLEEILNSYQ